MADEDVESIEGTSVGDDSPQDHIAHWVEVLDRWVKGVDLDMGRREGDPESPDGDPGDGATGLGGSYVRGQAAGHPAD